MDSQIIPMVYGLKVLKLGSVFVSANISANYMSQVYMEKVLVNQENPQPLVNLIWMFLLIDSIITIFILALAYISGTFINKNMSTVITLLALDTAVVLTNIALFGSIVATVMNNKKFFMYKDDGLRAIRALKEILTYFGMVFCLMPVFIAFQPFVSPPQPKTN
jgi:hypothetical protein|uniref:Uncharacterized protein n=1 Tax=viral metagenome TaxID=1070528 RepID=A0A6C0CU00_9ZZZZ